MKLSILISLLLLAGSFNLAQAAPYATKDDFKKIDQFLDNEQFSEATSYIKNKQLTETRLEPIPLANQKCIPFLKQCEKTDLSLDEVEKCKSDIEANCNEQLLSPKWKSLSIDVENNLAELGRNATAAKNIEKKSSTCKGKWGWGYVHGNDDAIQSLHPTSRVFQTEKDCEKAKKSDPKSSKLMGCSEFCKGRS